MAEAEAEGGETKARIEAAASEGEEAAAIEDRDEDKKVLIQLRLLHLKLLAKQILQRRQPLLLGTRRTRRLWRLPQSLMMTTMPKSASSAPTPLPTTRLRRATTRHAISAVYA